MVPTLSPWDRSRQTRRIDKHWFSCYLKYVSPNSPRETRFGSGTQVKPCRLGLRIGWVTFREYRREGHLWRSIHVLSFLFLLFCVLCAVIFKSVLKSKAYWALFRPPDLEKKTKYKYGSAFRMKIIILRAIVQSWNFDLLDYIDGEAGKLKNLGFPQC